jgi:large subunit ribosomal protein L25
VSEVRIAAEPRTEFGKGPARRARRAGKVPAVLYGHGTDPKHITLPGHELMLALKTANVLLRVEGLEGGPQLALPKDVQRDPIKGFLEHVDLLIVRRGEKVTVEIPIHVTGDVAPGGLLDQQMVQVALEADATNLPQAVEVDVEGMQVGTSVLARDLRLPEGTTLASDEEALVLHVLPAPTAEQIQAATGAEAEAPAEAAATGEGQAAEGASE